MSALVEAALLPLPGLSSPTDEVESTLARGGRWITFAAVRPDGAGRLDLYLYDRPAGQSLPVTGVNSPRDEVAPAIVAPK